MYRSKGQSIQIFEQDTTITSTCEKEHSVINIIINTIF